jgi:hypothetical protein
MEIKLSDEERQAIDARGAQEGDSYVVFSTQAYRQLMNHADPADLEDALQKTDDGIAQAERGETLVAANSVNGRSGR